MNLISRLIIFKNTTAPPKYGGLERRQETAAAPAVRLDSLNLIHDRKKQESAKEAVAAAPNQQSCKFDELKGEFDIKREIGRGKKSNNHFELECYYRLLRSGLQRYEEK